MEEALPGVIQAKDWQRGWSLDLGLLPGLLASKQAYKAFLQVSYSGWDMTLEAMNVGGGPWWLLRRGRKAMASVGSLARWPFLPLHPPTTTLGAPPCPLGPEGAAFPGFPPRGTTQTLAVGLCVTEGSLSATAQDTCVVHTQALMTFNTFLSLGFLPLCLVAQPRCSQPRGPPAVLLPHCGWGDLEPQGSTRVTFPPVLEEAPVGALSQWALGPYSQALLPPAQ